MEINIWGIPPSYPESLIGNYDEASSPDRFMFMEGMRVALGSPPVVRFGCKRGALAGYDIFHSSSGSPLISAKAAKLLEFASGDMQLVPVEAFTDEGPFPGIFLVNVLRVVQAVDYAQSEPIYFRGTNDIMKFNRLRCFPSKMDCHFAREKDYMAFIYVSCKVRAALEDSYTEGVSFYKPANVHP